MGVKRIIHHLAIVFAVFFGAVPAAGNAITIFAAASLQGPLDTVVDNWGGTARISYAGSGTLARQISLGAPADVVMLASPDWMTWLQTGGHLSAPARDIISGRLVMIGPRDAPPLTAATAKSLSARLSGRRLAMGQRVAVPAGVYAVQWLQAIDAWDALQPHLAETENVRAALTLVARGEAPLGIVYASDARAEPKVRILYEIPPEMYQTIRYPAAAVTTAGLGFLDYLATQQHVFEAAGFVPLP